MMKKKTEYWHEDLLLEDTNTNQGITKVFEISVKTYSQLTTPVCRWDFPTTSTAP